MTVRVHVRPAQLLDVLVTDLVAHDCLAHRTGAHECTVLHIPALDQTEAYREIRFFVHAWRALHPGADVTVMLGAP